MRFYRPLINVSVENTSGFRHGEEATGVFLEWAISLDLPIKNESIPFCKNTKPRVMIFFNGPPQDLPW